MRQQKLPEYQGAQILTNGKPTNVQPTHFPLAPQSRQHTGSRKMLTRIRYGQDATLSLDLSHEALVADCAEPHGFPLDDTVAAVQAALTAPLDFPPLANMVLPDDRVVVAVFRHVDQRGRRSSQLLLHLSERVLHLASRRGLCDEVVGRADSRRQDLSDRHDGDSSDADGDGHFERREAAA